ncbi:MAG: GNAT family N-acetyltransferase [Ignavibacteriae bacterium]|nr:MAG: GNAT family N-acetyltransferase [Ignavibacteriota bacterium]
MLTFDSITQKDNGTIATMLMESYEELLSTGQQFWHDQKDSWVKYDAEVFDHLTTIGQCIFLTRFDTDIIGFSSFDPRRGPSFGVIGHNCILPKFRGQGFGKRQIQETLRRLKMRSIRNVIVSTSEHPFFIPAQKMYLACGFQETKRYSGESQLGYRIIEYEMPLS